MITSRDGILLKMFIRSCNNEVEYIIMKVRAGVLLSTFTEASVDKCALSLSPCPDFSITERGCNYTKITIIRNQGYGL